MKYYLFLTVILQTVCISISDEGADITSGEILCQMFPDLCDTDAPTGSPTDPPSFSTAPSLEPSSLPSISPSLSQGPTTKPSLSTIPTDEPSALPSLGPTEKPSTIPTASPSTTPTTLPSITPTSQPTDEPSPEPSTIPTASPSATPTTSPSITPTSQPTDDPSPEPTSSPTTSPSVTPTASPSVSPTSQPTDDPSPEPTSSPTTSPSATPTSRPTESPSDQPTSAPTFGDRPNLIMILTDEHNLRTLGCYRDYLRYHEGYEEGYPWGNLKVETPNIDQLAAEGALFLNFFTSTPLCTPSRATFMSGLYPAETGAANNHGEMREDIVTFAEVLQNEREYYTGYFGKWHLNGKTKPGWGSEYSHKKFGFMETENLFNRGHWKFLDKENGIMKGYEYTNDAKNQFNGEYEKHFTTDFLTDRSIEFMEKARTKGDPFAFVLSIPDPHAPNEVRPPYDQMYAQAHFKIPSTARSAANKDPAPPKWHYHDHSEIPLTNINDHLAEYENSHRWQDHMQQYFGMVKCIDDNVGKLLNYLKGAGIDDDTVIVFTSDHGDMLQEHGKLNKGRPYKSSAGIPFIVRYPAKIQGGKLIKTAYTNVDFVPSILSLMGVSDTSYPGLDATNDLLNNEKQIDDRDQIRFVFDEGKKAMWAAAVTSRYKLVLSRLDVPWLFDYQTNPSEINNYFGKPRVAEIQQKLLVSLMEAMEEHDIALKDTASFILLSKPTCLDSRDRLPLQINGVCDDIGDSLPISQCDKEKISILCPVKCGKCCADSPGKLWASGELKGCSQLADKCDKRAVMEFCPNLCGAC